MSVVVPAPNGTTSRTGRLGKSCACAAAHGATAKALKTNAVANADRRVYERGKFRVEMDMAVYFQAAGAAGRGDQG